MTGAAIGLVRARPARRAVVAGLGAIAGDTPRVHRAAPHRLVLRGSTGPAPTNSNPSEALR